VPRGRTIFTFGDEPDAIFGLGEGLIDILVPIDEGEEVTIHRAQPGFWSGDGAALLGVPRLLSVTAATDCDVFRIPGARLRQVLAANPGDWRYLHHLATLNAALSIRVLAETLALPARPRFARVLLRLALPDGSVTATQEELGAMAGMSRAAFRRTLGALIEAGVFGTGRGTVRVNDREAPEREAGFGAG
jgi:CRP/FNR family transcriptional regulator, cyclic AMP receptor protein